MDDERRPPTFAAFGVRNFRLQFTAQMISETGAWFQTLAGSLLVLEVTGSAGAIAWLTVARFGAAALLAVPAGRLADRVAPRAILVTTAAATTLATGSLAVVTLIDPTAITAVYLFVALAGIAYAFERVTAQAFVYELVGPGLLQNAVALISTTQSVARSIGPAVAGFTYAAFGPGWCFLVNAVTTLVMLIAVLAIRPGELHSRRVDGQARAGIAEAVRLVARGRELRTLLGVAFTIALLAMSLNVIVTSVVSDDFGGDAAQLGIAHALNAVGAIGGGILVARFGRATLRGLVLPLTAFGITLALSGLAPSLVLLMVVAPLVGVALGLYMGTMQSAVQLATPPSALGRVMSLYTLVQSGSSPIAALIAGLVIDLSTGRVAFGVGAVASLACAALLAFMTMRGVRR